MFFLLPFHSVFSESFSERRCYAWAKKEYSPPNQGSTSRPRAQRIDVHCSQVWRPLSYPGAPQKVEYNKQRLAMTHLKKSSPTKYETFLCSDFKLKTLLNVQSWKEINRTGTRKCNLSYVRRSLYHLASQPINEIIHIESAIV